jgi:hypothetical protein
MHQACGKRPLNACLNLTGERGMRREKCSLCGTYVSERNSRDRAGVQTRVPGLFPTTDPYVGLWEILVTDSIPGYIGKRKE